MFYSIKKILIQNVKIKVRLTAKNIIWAETKVGFSEPIVFNEKALV